MNGATADDCATNRSMPKIMDTTITGNSQYFFRLIRNANNSERIDMSQLLKLLIHRRRGSRLTVDPVGAPIRLVVQP